jgi:hypothetical protein
VPGLNMTKSSLKRIELGVLPVTSISNMPEKHLVGSSQIRSNQGYIEVLSTKYTTFLSQARAVLALIQV